MHINTQKIQPYVDTCFEDINYKLIFLKYGLKRCNDSELYCYVLKKIIDFSKNIDDLADEFINERIKLCKYYFF